MKQEKKKTPASSSKKPRKTGEFRRSLSCNRPTFDRYVFAHFLYGFYAGCVCVGISSILFIRFGYSRELVNLLVAVFIPSAFAVIILLDVIEHTFVHHSYFVKVLGDKNWCESFKNVLVDMILAFAAFIIVVMPTLYFVEDTQVMTFISIAPFFFLPFFVFIIWNSKHKKWRGFFFEKKPKEKGKFYWKESRMDTSNKDSALYGWLSGGSTDDRSKTRNTKK